MDVRFEVHIVFIVLSNETYSQITSENSGGGVRAFLVKCIIQCPPSGSTPVSGSSKMLKDVAFPQGACGATISTEARAHNKKLAQRQACERMIEQIQSFGLVANNFVGDSGFSEPAPTTSQLAATRRQRATRDKRRPILTKASQRKNSL